MCLERRRRWSLEVDSTDVYLATCEQDGVAPQVAIVRALPEREINVRHRCLGDQDAHALSVSICVRIDVPPTLTHVRAHALYSPLNNRSQRHHDTAMNRVQILFFSFTYKEVSK